jgi:hypothetical protein
MVTISANKGDRLKIVADAWHMEEDCEFRTFSLFQTQPVYLLLLMLNPGFP